MSERRWAAAAIATGAVVAALVAPSGSAERNAGPREPPGEHHARVQSELAARARSYDAARTAIAQIAPGNRDKFVLLGGQNASEKFSRAVQFSMHEAFRRLPRSDQDVRVMVVLANDTSDFSAEDSVKSASPAWTIDAFAPGIIASHTCAIVVHRIHWPDTAKSRRHDRQEPEFAGPCWWYAAFGLPGKGVANWLDSTHASALSMHTAASGRFVAGLRPPEPRSRVQHIVEPRLGACLANKTHACSELMLHRQRETANDAFPFTPGWNGGGRDFAFTPDTLVSSLLEYMMFEFGPDAFTSILRSEKSLADAFSETTHRTLDAWTLQALSGRRARYVAGPLFSPGTMLFSLITIAALLGASSMAAVRR